MYCAAPTAGARGNRALNLPVLTTCNASPTVLPLGPSFYSVLRDYGPSGIRGKYPVEADAGLAERTRLFLKFKPGDNERMCRSCAGDLRASTNREARGKSAHPPASSNAHATGGGVGDDCNPETGADGDESDAACDQRRSTPVKRRRPASKSQTLFSPSFLRYQLESD